MHFIPKSMKNTSWLVLDCVALALALALAWVVDDVRKWTEFDNKVVVVDDDDDESRREEEWEKKNKFVVEQADIPVAWSASHTELDMSTAIIRILIIHSLIIKI